MPATLHLLCGLPGAGKTTLAKQLADGPGVVRLCPDEWLLDLMADPSCRAEMDRLRTPVEQLQRKLAHQLLATGVDVVLENGFWRAAERVDYRDRAAETGARVHLHYLELPIAELKRRVEFRNATLAAQALHITAQELDLWAAEFEVPEASETIGYHHMHRYGERR